MRSCRSSRIARQCYDITLIYNLTVTKQQTVAMSIQTAKTVVAFDYNVQAVAVRVVAGSHRAVMQGADFCSCRHRYINSVVDSFPAANRAYTIPVIVRYIGNPFPRNRTTDKLAITPVCHAKLEYSRLLLIHKQLDYGCQWLCSQSSVKNTLTVLHFLSERNTILRIKESLQVFLDSISIEITVHSRQIRHKHKSVMPHRAYVKAIFVIIGVFDSDILNPQE
jgi:hypothetical protein